MSRPKNTQELNEHKENALRTVESYLDSLIASNNPKLYGKADKFSYWLEDYIKFLDYEPNFSPSNLKRYKRGEVIKAHLGYNIGSEEGGLHYCIVLDKDNSIYNPVLTVIPLTSIKPDKDVSNLKKSEIFLEDELYNKLSKKTNDYLDETSNHFNDVNDAIAQLKTGSTSEIILTNLKKEQAAIAEELKFLSNMVKEVKKMKRGSIALVNQITTISKLRIYDPKTSHDVLSGIRFSGEKLDLIDAEIIKMYTR